VPGVEKKKKFLWSHPPFSKPEIPQGNGGGELKKEGKGPWGKKIDVKPKRRWEKEKPSGDRVKKRGTLRKKKEKKQEPSDQETSCQGKSKTTR